MAVTITYAIAGDKQVELQWDAISGATNYRVFSYLNGGYTTLGETTATSYTATNLTNGTRYGFLVRAYVNGEWSAFSSEDVIYATPSSSCDETVLSCNESSTRYELETVTVNEGGTRYELDTIQSNEGGTRYEIFSAWAFPVLEDYYEAHPDVSFEGTSRSWTLNGDTYSGEVFRSTKANFSLRGSTKITIKLTTYDYGYDYGTYVSYGEGIYDPQSSSELNPDVTNIAYIYGQPIDQSNYNTVSLLEASVILPKGDYFIDVSSYRKNSGSANTGTTARFTIKFEKA